MKYSVFLLTRSVSEDGAHISSLTLRVRNDPGCPPACRNAMAAFILYAVHQATDTNTNRYGIGCMAPSAEVKRRVKQVVKQLNADFPDVECALSLNRRINC